jgi:hypothetical protein
MSMANPERIAQTVKAFGKTALEHHLAEARFAETREQYRLGLHQAMCNGAKLRSLARAKLAATQGHYTEAEAEAEEGRMEKLLSTYRTSRGLTPCGHKPRTLTRRSTIEEWEPYPR